MTRIISGAAGGLRLDVPGSGTRPTSDRVRESLFSGLESADAIEDARVLDLYAGSGALGLEALSRGARSADLVERARPAAAIVRRNAQHVAKAPGVSGTARVHESPVRAYLRRAGAARYDLVFIDPPYDLSPDDVDGDLLALAPLLSADAIVVIERGRRASAPALSAAGLESMRERAYGDTVLWWARPAGTD
ncbi:16S rRNA (guanine(966)-N(2))-methyltransferase RsmD [Microbacterium pseudoresistens]|uniref:16S rRNA (Guanine966-N2)-methyltransferase n=1 Tax=Microbacterium pseudoresistens TaxID=640634 RepID=A0A7Y9EWW0_9MICO|nr:16S rRNA (guanine966-N2)-methyltransferase [Microbacterium pseudoresistens]